MRRSIDDDQIPVPAPFDEDVTPVNWALSISDDYDDASPRLQLTVEEVGAPGTGLVAHLDADAARRLRLAIGTALRQVGEDEGR